MIPVRVVLSNNGKGFAVYVPGMPGVNAQGENEQIALANARRLIRQRLLSDTGQSIDHAGVSKVIDLDAPA